MTPAPPADPEEQYALGARLLIRPQSRDSFDRGAALIEAAAAQGHAEATALLATMAAVGAGGSQNWTRAFERLRRAAELGSERAAGQLRLLGGGGDQADIAGLLRAPQGRVLSMRPALLGFEGFATRAECEWLTASFRPRLAPALVFDEATGLGKVDPSRTASAVELWLPEMDVVSEMLRARIAAATGLSEAIFEVPQVIHYSVGQLFHRHHDYFDPVGLAVESARGGQRVGTFLIYLNEDYDGGETEFADAGLTFRGRTGDALYFANVLPDGRPDPLTLHSGRPPSRGEKWIFSQWIRAWPPSLG